MSRLLRTYFSIFWIAVSLCQAAVQPGTAQSPRDYTLANQLIQQERYEDALELLRPLLDQKPNSLPVFQSTMECLVQLKEYETAINLTHKSLRGGLDAVQGNVKLAELQHLRGDTEQAIATWNEVLKKRPSLGTYLTVARSMKDRGVYKEALKVYESAQEQFENSRLFLHEVAYTYLLAGEYEPAMRSFVQLIIQNPRRFGYVQRNLQRFSDESLYDAAILETEDALDRNDLSPEVFNQLVQLDLWLLMERNLYDRAIASVSRWIRQDKASPYLLINLGQRLRGVMAYQAAIKSFERAISASADDLQASAMYEQAQTYEHWAVQERHQNRLAMVDADSLYGRAQSTYETLLDRYPYYERRKQAYRSLSEIALDVEQDTTTARNWLNRMKRQLNDPESDFDYNYLMGKMALYQRDFMQTRIHLTRALKLRESNQQRERMRYLLGLADFYEGDYEFARTQLDALKRQSTSLFANNALQLKLWLNEGSYADSTGQSLAWLSRLHQQVQQRDFDSALLALDSLRATPAGSVLEDDAMFLLSQSVPEDRVATYYIELDTYLASSTGSPLHERLLWERIQRADQLVRQSERNGQPIDRPNPSEQTQSDIRLPQSQEDITRLINELLEAYPQGFYAGEARQKLRSLSESEPPTTS
jgi:tetratricopeptide (TPR) repeat protein